MHCYLLYKNLVDFSTKFRHVAQHWRNLAGESPEHVLVAESV